MKILIVTARFYPEPFTISRIAEQLKNKDHEITVLTGVPNYGQWKVYDGYENKFEDELNGIKIIRINERLRKQGTLSLIRNYWSIYREFRKKLKKLDGDYDIVFSHVMSPIFTMDYIGKYCARHNIPHFHYGFDLWPESLVATGYFKKKSLFIKLFKHYCKKRYNTCDLITFASPSSENYFKNYLDVKVPFKHIYQPCLTTPPNIEIVNNHTYKKDGKIHILFCGTLAKFNHLELFIEALVEHRDSFIFDVVGSGSEYDRIVALVKKYDLDDIVRFHGRVTSEETKKYYAEADILFVPLFWNSATSEMIPQKLVEYFMYGRPILGMLKGDGRTLLEEASNLNIHSDQTVNDLSNALEKIKHMTLEEIISCGRDNRNYFDNKKEFTLEYVTDKIEECMVELVKQKKIKID